MVVMQKLSLAFSLTAPVEPLKCEVYAYTLCVKYY
jgi:hypothetical protein